jgi:hypothetical protein
VEQYTGTITTDLFAEDETSYFDDAEQFMTLQKEAVAQLVKHHEASAAWLEVRLHTKKGRARGGVEAARRALGVLGYHGGVGDRRASH